MTTCDKCKFCGKSDKVDHSVDDVCNDCFSVLDPLCASVGAGTILVMIGLFYIFGPYIPIILQPSIAVVCVIAWFYAWFTIPDKLTVWSLKRDGKI